MFLLVIVAPSQNQLQLLATIAETNKLRDLFILEHVTVGNDSFNFYHNNERCGIIFDEPESLKMNRLSSSSFFLLTFSKSILLDFSAKIAQNSGNLQKRSFGNDRL